MDARMEDAELVEAEGRRYLKNKVTGEVFYSLCGIHASHRSSCALCHKGWWAFDPYGELG